ncbi:PH domain-containing protein [Crocinitomix algicola]|uniref:PH domain-containing protein n=1 Tax=Crocinitomix algicola TaxID=1740263 RepID=UPI000871FD2C|nr:PH domain-containing protein [Crocinitomix algicola]
MYKSYKVKIDWWFVILVELICIAPIPFIYSSNSDFSEVILPSIILLISAIGVGYIFMGTKYYIDKNQFFIKAGFLMKINIPVEKIRSIEKTNSKLSAPAPSFDRLLIKYNKYDEVIISPNNQKELAADLLQINAEIQVNL